MTETGRTCSIRRTGGEGDQLKGSDSSGSHLDRQPLLGRSAVVFDLSCDRVGRDQLPHTCCPFRVGRHGQPVGFELTKKCQRVSVPVRSTTHTELAPVPAVGHHDLPSVRPLDQERRHVVGLDQLLGRIAGEPRSQFQITHALTVEEALVDAMSRRVEACPGGCSLQGELFLQHQRLAVIAGGFDPVGAPVTLLQEARFEPPGRRPGALALLAPHPHTPRHVLTGCNRLAGPRDQHTGITDDAWTRFPIDLDLVGLLPGDSIREPPRQTRRPDPEAENSAPQVFDAQLGRRNVQWHGHHRRTSLASLDAGTDRATTQLHDDDGRPVTDSTSRPRSCQKRLGIRDGKRGWNLGQRRMRCRFG